MVGGGPAGLLLGLLLAKRGVDVIVLEAHETFDREFRGEVLQPSTAHLLDELGLLEYILTQPHSTLTEGLIRINGKTAGEFSFKTIVPEYPYAIWMPQPIFLQALVEKAAPFQQLSVLDGSQGDRSSSRKRGRSSVYRANAMARSPLRSGRTSWWGLMDARHRMRRLGHFDMEYEHHDFDVIWFVIEQPADWPNTIYFSLGSDVQGLMLPKYPHHIQAGLFLPEGGVAGLAGSRYRRRGRARAALRPSLHRVCRESARLQTLLPTCGTDYPGQRLGS